MQGGCISLVSLEKQLKIARGDVPRAAGSCCQVCFILQQLWDSVPGHAPCLEPGLGKGGLGLGCHKPAPQLGWATGGALCSALGATVLTGSLPSSSGTPSPEPQQELLGASLTRRMEVVSVSLSLVRGFAL